MADGTTPRGYVLPEVGGSVDTWGSKLNDNFGEIDEDVTWNEDAIGDDYDVGTNGTIKDRLDTAEADIDATEIVADGALQRTGGAMTGKTDVHTATTRYEAMGDQSGTVDLDIDEYNYFQLNLTGVTTITLSVTTPLPTDQMIVVLVEITANAYNEDVTWPAGVKWAYGESGPTLSDTGTDVIALITTDGTNWLGSVSMPDVR